MQKRLLTGVGLLAVLAAIIQSTNAAGPGVNASQKQLRTYQPAILTHEIDPADVHPLPANVPVQRWVVGKGLVDEGGVAGATGTRVYQNTLGTNFFAPGVNVNIADDIQLISAGGCDMSWIELRVTGGGDGTGAGFNMTWSLFNGCPNQGGTLVPGSQVTEMLPNNGVFLVNMDYEGALVAIPENPWLRVSFSTAAAGWIFGRPAQIGFTANLFDHPMFPCTTQFTGGVPYSGYYADVFCGGDVSSQFIAYQSNVDSGFFDAMTLTEMIADDIVPITAPTLCEFVRYDTLIFSTAGNYTMKNEIFSHDETNNRPMAPVMGTLKNCPGTANNLLTCTHTVFPPIEIPTAQFWITYDVATNAAGPLLAGDFPPVGFSEDGFSIFGMPDAGVWSPPVWFYGGCPGDDPNDIVPCGTFHENVYCFGTAPVGACCDLMGKELCTNDTQIQQCADGRWMQNAMCEADPFDPPCGTASCCTPDESCNNMTAEGCATAGGEWQPGLFCGDKGQSCPPLACIGATNSCFEAGMGTDVGCSDASCCALICGLDPFCCEVAWEQVCANNALANCPVTPPNDDCDAAIPIGDGTFDFNTTLATTDGLMLPEDPCDEGFGVALGKDIWYNFTAPMTGMTTVSLCNGTDFDSRIAVHTGCACPAVAASILDCDDDGCGDVGVPSEMTFAVTAGECYKLRIGGFAEESGMGSASVETTAGTGCPEGAVAFVTPLSGVVDARQPHPVSSPMPLQGLSTFMVTAPEGGSTGCWSLCETVAGMTPNSVMSVMNTGGTNYTITLARPITPGAVTTLTYTANGGAMTTGSFTFHPANVNGDPLAAPTDILRLIDCLNNVNPGGNCRHGILSTDLDRSGVFGPADILKGIDMLNGADAYIPWLNTPLPTNNGVCP